MIPVIYPYKIGSSSAIALVTTLGNNLNRTVRRVRQDSRTFIHKPTRLVVNWGNSHAPAWRNPASKWLNKPEAVAVAGNKLLSFQALQGNVNIPEWTTDIEVANDWIANGFTVLARHSLTSHSGNGITVHDQPDLGRAPLYVQYKKKKKEFRVHVFGGIVIDVQEKRKEKGVERDERTSKIRNRANGWVFCRDGIDEPVQLREQAIAAVNCLNLDFGAVDVIWNERENKCYTLEVNTAPGLEGTTLENYTKAILEVL